MKHGRKKQYLGNYYSVRLGLDEHGFMTSIEDSSTSIIESIHEKVEGAKGKCNPEIIEKYSTLEEIQSGGAYSYYELNESWDAGIKRTITHRREDDNITVRLHVHIEGSPEWILYGDKTSENTLRMGRSVIYVLDGATVERGMLRAFSKDKIINVTLSIRTEEMFEACHDYCGIADTVIIVDKGDSNAALTLSSMVLTKSEYVPVIEFSDEYERNLKYLIFKEHKLNDRSSLLDSTDKLKTSLDLKKQLAANDPTHIVNIIKRLKPKRILSSRKLVPMFKSLIGNVQVTYIDLTNNELIKSAYMEINEMECRGFYSIREVSLFPAALREARKNKYILVPSQLDEYDLIQITETDTLDDSKHIIIIDDFEGVAPVIAANYAVCTDAKIITVDVSSLDEAVQPASEIAKIAILLMDEDLCLFCWEEVPGNDSGRLKVFLKQKFSINWVETAKIEKIDDFKTIRLSFENNFLFFKLNDTKNRVKLELDNGRTAEFIAQNKNGKLNIFKNFIEAKKQLDDLSYYFETFFEDHIETIFKAEKITIFSRLLDVKINEHELGYSIPAPYSIIRHNGTLLGEKKVGYVIERPDLIVLRCLMNERIRKYPVSVLLLADPFGEENPSKLALLCNPCGKGICSEKLTFPEGAAAYTIYLGKEQAGIEKIRTLSSNASEIFVISHGSPEGIFFRDGLYIEVVGMDHTNLYKIPYLFSWEDVPGNDTKRLKEFLWQKFNINWIEIARVEKSYDLNTIRLYFENNFLHLELDEKKNKVTLKIDDGRSAEFITQIEDSKLNIYEISVWHHHDKIKPDSLLDLSFSFPPVCVMHTCYSIVAASALISGGCGAVVSSLYSVGNDESRIVSHDIHETLINYGSIGEALSKLYKKIDYDQYPDIITKCAYIPIGLPDTKNPVLLREDDESLAEFIIHDVFMVLEKTKNLFGFEYAEKLFRNSFYNLFETYRSSKENDALIDSNLGIFYIYSDPSEALDRFQHAYDIHKSLGNQMGMASDLGNMGLIYKNKGEIQKALDYFQHAYDINELLGNQMGMANQLGNIGLIYKDTGETQKALDHFHQAYDIHDSLGNKLGMANQLGNIGLIYKDTGEIQKALDHFHQAYDIHKSLGNQPGMASDLGNVGLIYKNSGEIQKALDHFHQAYDIHKSLGYQMGMVTSLENIGLIYKNTGETQKALDYFHQAYDIHESLDIQPGMASDLGNIGLIYMDTGEPQKALDYFHQAYDIHKSLDSKPGMASDLGNMGLIYKDTGETQKALDYFHQAYDIHKSLDSKPGMASDLGNMELIYKDTGEKQKAFDHIEQHSKHFQRSDMQKELKK